MKIILLFDGLDGQYREYELDPKFDRLLKDGRKVNIRFCHPFHGEVMIVETMGGEDAQD